MMRPASAFSRNARHRSRDGEGFPLLQPLLHRIVASLDLAEKASGFAAGLLRCQSAVLADGKASRAALTIAELDQKRFDAAWLHPKTKAPQLVIQSTRSTPSDLIAAIVRFVSFIFSARVSRG